MHGLTLIQTTYSLKQTQSKTVCPATWQHLPLITDGLSNLAELGLDRAPADTVTSLKARQTEIIWLLQ